MPISAEGLMELVYFKRLSDALMDRICRNYRFDMGINGGLFAFGSLGGLAPATSVPLYLEKPLCP